MTAENIFATNTSLPQAEETAMGGGSSPNGERQTTMEDRNDVNLPQDDLDTGENFLKKWDPQDKKYLTCCCHVKAFTMALSVIELIFVIIAIYLTLEHLSEVDPAVTHYHVEHKHHLVSNFSNVNVSKFNGQYSKGDKLPTYVESNKQAEGAEFGMLGEKMYYSSGGRGMGRNKNLYGHTRVEKVNETALKIRIEYDYYYVYSYGHGYLISYLVYFCGLGCCVGLLIHGLRTGKYWFLLAHVIYESVWSFTVGWHLMQLLALWVRHSFVHDFVLGVVLWELPMFAFTVYAIKNVIACMVFMRDQQRHLGGPVTSATIVPVYMVGGPDGSGAKVHISTQVVRGQRVERPPQYLVPDVGALPPVEGGTAAFSRYMTSSTTSGGRLSTGNAAVKVQNDDQSGPPDLV